MSSTSRSACSGNHDTQPSVPTGTSNSRPLYISAAAAINNVDRLPPAVPKSAAKHQSTVMKINTGSNSEGISTTVGQLQEIYRGKHQASEVQRTCACSFALLATARSAALLDAASDSNKGSEGPGRRSDSVPEFPGSCLPTSGRPPIGAPLPRNISP